MFSVGPALVEGRRRCKVAFGCQSVLPAVWAVAEGFPGASNVVCRLLSRFQGPVEGLCYFCECRLCVDSLCRVHGSPCQSTPCEATMYIRQTVS